MGQISKVSFCFMGLYHLNFRINGPLSMYAVLLHCSVALEQSVLHLNLKPHDAFWLHDTNLTGIHFCTLSWKKQSVLFIADKLRGCEDQGAVLHLLGHIEEGCQPCCSASVHCRHQQETGWNLLPSNWYIILVWLLVSWAICWTVFPDYHIFTWWFGFTIQARLFLPGKICGCRLCKRLPEVSRLCTEMQRWIIWGLVGPGLQWKNEGTV